MKCRDCGAEFVVECPYCGSRRVYRRSSRKKKRKRRPWF